MINEAEVVPYARALYELFHGDKVQLQEAISVFNSIKQAIQVEPQIGTLLREPSLSREIKLNLLFKLSPELQTNELLNKTVHLLAEKKKLHFLSHIGPRIEEILNEENNISKIMLTTAKELNQDQIENIKSSLQRSLGQEIKLNVSVDEDLISGVVIQTNEYLIDNSLRGRLNKIKQLVV